MAAAALGQEPLTRSVEDYLKTIYLLSQRGEPAATNDIAHQLELSAPSVSGMIKRLAEQGLVEHEPYKGVELTREGRRLAIRMVRRHRVLEAYLVARLGYDWDGVHEEAERLEHAVSDALINRMAAALGDPQVDPHGDPIPTADGWVEDLIFPPLVEVSVGTEAEIRRVSADDPERLRYLASLGLKPGTRVTVVDRQPFRGPTTVRVGEQTHTIGHELASTLLCAPTL
jgi:DtxR family transcriptional regulator, Mn-dependent transcriptional regulator